MQPATPPSSDYVPRPEHPQSPDYVPDPEHPPSPVEVPYVPEPEHPEYLVPSEDEAPIEDQPLSADASPTALSPGYVADSDPDKDLEEDPEEDHVDYPVDGGDGDDKPYDDDDDDDDTDDEDEEPFEDEEDDEEQDEHLASADSSVIHVVDPTCLRRSRKTVRLKPPMSASIEAYIAEHAVAPTPPLHVSSPPLPLPSQLTTSPTDAGAPLGYRARACFTTFAPGLEVEESSAAGAVRQPGPALEAGLRRNRVKGMGYGITDTWDEIVEAMMEIAPTTLEEVNQKVTELATTVRQDTEEFQATYARRAWAGSKDGSATIKAHVRTLEAHVSTLISQTLSLQTQLTISLVCIETRRLETQSLRRSQLRLAAAASHKMAPRKRTTRTSPATTTTTTTPVTDAQLRALIAQGVAAALAERKADKSRNVDDNNDSGTGGRRQVSNVRECTYTDFLKCQPMNFKGIEGVVRNTLTWWNSHIRAVKHDVAYAMPWKTLKKIMTNKYCPRSKIKESETKMWNLKVKGTDVMTYSQRFQELALMCDRMFLGESDVVEKYVGGLPDMIHGSVKASKPKTMQEAIEFVTKLIDKKILTIGERQADNKRNFKDTSRNNQNQQQQFRTMWHGLTLLGLVRRNLTEGLNLYAPNSTITTMGRVLPSALTTRGLAIRSMTVKVSG
uniref:Retrotransposon gag domain-containing protein n=1 Tax=Tanacetum cinerariifolium TaxID=118510 RepID=A0A6L2LNY7_TANCI|nr:hypothetical protein [Tanacetum cinerariifolium]